MLSAVLAEVEAWFENDVHAPPRASDDAGAAIAAMFEAVTASFSSGRRACPMGVLAVSEVRDRFATVIAPYVMRWVEALEVSLRHLGPQPCVCRISAEEIVLGIRGAIVLARALDDPAVFERVVEQMWAMLRRIDDRPNHHDNPRSDP